MQREESVSWKVNTDINVIRGPVLSFPSATSSRNTVQQSMLGVWGLHPPGWEGTYGLTVLCPSAIFTEAVRILLNGESNYRKRRLLWVKTWMSPRRAGLHPSSETGFLQLWALLSQAYQCNLLAFSYCGFTSLLLQPSICKMQIHIEFLTLKHITVFKALLLSSAEEPERQLMILHSAESLDCL